MRFAFIADVPGWALHREGLGLAKYGAVDGHSWDLFHCNPFDCTSEEIEGYDAVRLGAASNLLWHIMHQRCPVHPKIVLSLSSFHDIPRAEPVLLNLIPKHVAAFAVVDPRLVAHCAQFGKPTFVFSDRCDHELFFPKPALRPTQGPLRVGWAGSQIHWPGVKNRDLIEEACKRLGLQFVRQDRELDGVKTADEMREWYASLDLYAVANIEATPTPVPWLEAAACGVQVVGTRCGELWPLLYAHTPEAIVEAPTLDAIVGALGRMAGLGRQALHDCGMDFHLRYAHYLYWSRSTAQQHTRDVASLCGSEVREC